MKSKLLAGFLFLYFFSACSSDTAPPASDDDIGTASGFIRAALDGDYSAARTMIIADSVNIQYLDLYERNYKNRMTPEDKRGYKGSSINIRRISKVNDSVTVMRYSNSYKQKEDSVKVVLDKGRWSVDLKYSFPQTGRPL